MTNNRKIFVNLPVKDLQRSIEFFTKLGFAFNQQFADDKAACMVISEEAYVMLLTEPFFKTFTTRDVCDTTSQAEGCSRSRAAAARKWMKWSIKRSRRVGSTP